MGLTGGLVDRPPLSGGCTPTFGPVSLGCAVGVGGGGGGGGRGGHRELVGRRPAAALGDFAVGVVVAGTHPHAVFSSLFEADCRVGRTGGVGVAACDRVVIPKGRPSAAGLLPGDPVVVGGVAGRVPS